MDNSQNDARMEGWLYLVRTNRLGLQYSRKRYFVLQGNFLNCYKSFPQSNIEDPERSSLIHPHINVVDNGEERMHKNVLFMFTLHNAYNCSDQLRLGGRSSEEVAKWMRSLKEALLENCPDKKENIMASSSKGRQSLSVMSTKKLQFNPRRDEQPSIDDILICSKNKSRIRSLDWTTSLTARLDPLASDASTWTIFGCTNGLRLFKEVMDKDLQQKNCDYNPAIMAVGVVDANSEAIFQTLMSLGPSRSEWDFCLSHGSTIEHLNGNADIIHKKLHGDWLPRGMTRRDLLLQRCWRKEDDGTYAIVYHSVLHSNCKPKKGYVRACIKSGGYLISPVNQGKQSVVKHMLAIDWRSWRSYLFGSSGEYITIRMLARVAALREFFRAKLGNGDYNFSSGDLKREIVLPQSETEDIKLELDSKCADNKNGDYVEELQYLSPKSWDMDEPFLQFSDVSADQDVADDQFFDVSVGHEFDQSESLWPSNDDMQSQLAQDHCYHKLPTKSDLVGRLQEHARTASKDDNAPTSYGTTLPKDPSFTMHCSWASADPSTFLIRSESYLQDNRKIKAKSTLMELVAADWLKSGKREDNLGSRSGGIVQKHALEGSSKFFFIVNMQVPGSNVYSLALYYMMDSPTESVPLLQSFLEGNDTYRDSRFKLIPYISKGSWVVKQSVGKKACLMGQSLKLNYFQGRNYFEVGIDVTSSAVARSVTRLVLNYLNNLVVELAFLIQGNTQDELPEVLLGTCRLNHMDVSKAVTIDS